MNAASPGTIVGHHRDRDGIGVRIDCRLPFGGTLRLVHWFVSAFAAAPDGIVEEPHGMDLKVLGRFTTRTLLLGPNEICTPVDRHARRNLVSGQDGRLLGLRGWDIPHDRHAILSEPTEGWAEMAPASLAPTWRQVTGIRIGGKLLRLGAQSGTFGPNFR